MPPKKKTMASTGSKPNQTGKSIFGTSVPDMQFDPNDRTLSEVGQYKTRYVDINKIQLYAHNEMRALDTSELEISIDTVGLLSPILLITVEDEEGEHYEPISGNRRLTAVRNLLSRAVEENDKERIERYSKIFSIVLPLGATEEEIQRVYGDMNILHRPPSLTEMFQLIDRFLEKDDQGNFKNLAKKRPNIAQYIQQRFKNLGYDFGLTKVKTYVVIWNAHNQRIREEFINEALTFRQALAIAKLPDQLQDHLMDNIGEMTSKDITAYLKTYNLQNKEIKGTSLRSIDMLSDLNKAGKIMTQLAGYQKVVITKKEDKGELIGLINELSKVLKDLKELVK